jgi:hypothetical protein
VDVRVERGSRGLGRRPVEDGDDTCRVVRGAYGGLGLKTIGGRFHGFGPQNPGGGSEEEQTTHGGIEEKLSHEGHGGRRMKITSGWTITLLGYVVRLKISRGKTGIV